MKMYKCPDCGKTYTSMYCDHCGKTISPQHAVFGAEAGGNSGLADGTDATNIILEKINSTEKENNELLSAIQRNTKIVAVISIISAVAAVLSAVITVISVVPFL